MEDNNSINEIAGMKVYSSAEELSAAMNQQQEPNDQAEQQEPDYNQSQQVDDSDMQQTQGDPVGDADYSSQPQYTEDEVEEAVINFLSERLGRDLSSLDDLQNSGFQMDERLDAIARFVQDTGRSPEDWFAYQSLDPTEMDDLMAVRVDMASTYPNLSREELDLMISSKYKMDPDLYSEDEVRLSQVQLKVDAENARRAIDGLRENYRAPEARDGGYESFIDDDWLDTMSMEVDSLEGLEFDLGNGNTFTFGIDDRYKNSLKDRNANLESFFDDYVNDDGSWDYDLLSSHMTLIDNIDAIVASVYKQGLGDGQKNIVNKAANIQTQTPTQTGQQPNPIADQLRNILGNQNNKLTFRI